MVDNIVVNATTTTGVTLATDDHTSVHHPLIKVEWGGDTTVNRVDTTSPLPAQLRSSSGTELATAGAPLRVDPTGTTAQPVTKSGTWTLDANSGVDIGDVDVLSVVPGTGATNLGKAVDSIPGGTDTGVAMLAVRVDTLGAITPADGDYARLQVNSTGQLHVTGGGGGTQYVEDAPLGGSPTGTLAMGRRDDTLATLAAGEDDAIGFRVNNRGALWTKHDGAISTAFDGLFEDAPSGGGEAGILALGIRQDGDTSPVSLSGDFHSMVFDNLGNLKVHAKAVIPGTGATNLGKLNGAVFNSTNDVGVPIHVVRKDAGGVFTNVTDGDYTPLQTDSSGRLRVVTQGGAGGTSSVDDAVFTVATDSGTPAMGIVTNDTVATNDVGVLRMNANRDLHTLMVTDDGGSAMDDGNSALRVNVVAGSSGGVTHTDDAAFTVTTDDIVPAGAMFNDVTPDSVDEGDAGVLRMSANRNLYTTIRDAGGSERGVNVNSTNRLAVVIEQDDVGIGGGTQYTEGNTDTTITGTAILWEDAADTLRAVSAANPLPVDLTTDSLSGNLDVNIAADAVGLATNATDDAAFTAGAGTGVPAMGFASSDTVNAGDVGVFRMDTRRQLHTTIYDASGADRGANVDASNRLAVIADAGTGTFTVDGSGVTQPVSGTVTANAGTGDFLSIAGHTTNEALKEAMAVGGQLDDTTTTAATDKNVAPARITAQRAFHTNLRKADGTEIANGGGTQADALRVTVASDSTGVLSVDDNGSSISVDTATGALDVSGATVTVDLGANNDVTATGNVAHDAADSGNPLKLGAKAVAHSANPTAVAANDRSDLYCNRHGVLFTTGGHPNSISRTARSTAAQTGSLLSTDISAGTKIVVTRVTALCDNANTVDVRVKVGFSTTTTLPADSATGTNGIIMDHPGIPAGGGVTIGDGSGIIAVGGDGEDLRYDCEVPTTGAVTVTATYYTIES